MDNGKQPFGDSAIVSSINRSHPRRLWTMLLVGVVGCSRSEPVDDRLAASDPTALVPVSGVVTFNGKPRATVVITFLPAHGPALAVSETDQDGKYVLESMGGPGALPGEYKVGISYLVSDKGEPQGIGPRNSLVQGPGMLSAKELVPREYDLGRTKLTAKVGPKGDRFDFNLPVDIPDVALKTAEKKAAEGKPAEEKQKPTEKKTTEPKKE
jgi:hypothetical protein